MVRLMLVLGLVLSLAACGGSRTDGLSKADEDALEARLEAAEAERAAAEADKVAAEADKAAAEADKVAAEADKAAAEADKVAAEADKAAAEAAQAAAEAAQAAAEADKTIAEAAQAAAEAAQAAAEAAQAAAEAAQAAAEADKAIAEAAQAAAEADKVAAEADKAAAEADKTAAEAAQARAEAEVQHQLRAAQAARQEAETARQEAETARQEAATARGEAETARQETETAEQTRDRLAEEAEEARQQLLTAQASIGYAGFARPALGEPSVTAKYNAPALVVAPANTDPSVSFTSPRGSSAGRWYATRVEKQGQTTHDTILVYSDVERTKQVARDEHPIYLTVFPSANEDGFYELEFPVGIGQNETHKDVIRSSAFPVRGGTTTPELKGVDANEMPVTENADHYVLKSAITGTFAGAGGRFHCTASADDGCTVHHTGSGYEFLAGTWTFVTSSKTPKFDLADQSHMSFGWWRRQTTSGEPSFSYSTFSNEGFGATAAGFNRLTGTYTYEGPAIGQYAIHQPLGTQSNLGEFKAAARFTANFGAADSGGTISGTVSEFNVSPSWSLTLNEAEMNNGTVTPNDVSWTIDGITHDGKADDANIQDRAMWSGSFHSEITYVDHVPDGLTGEFRAVFRDVGRLVGAYGTYLK